MRTPLALLALLLVAGCPSERLEQSSGDVKALFSSLGFNRTYVGKTRTVTLKLQNTAAAPRGVRLVAAAPFFTQAAATIGAGSFASVPIEFRPTLPGDVSGRLTVAADGQEPFAVVLAGRADALPPCNAAGPCLVTEADPDRGECLEKPAPDGQACSSACLTQGQCLGGACVGALLACDDGNPCTADFCDPVRGCLHSPQVPACPAPPGPCQVPSCDPNRPCALDPAPDGTPCGPGDCASAQVCMAGACVARPAPDGAPCGEAGLCWGRGTCKAGQCRPAPVTMLQPLWTVPVPDAGPFGSLFREVMADPDGNLFASLWDGKTDSLVWYTPDGLERRRTSIARLYTALVTEGLVVSAEDWATLVARRTADGSEVWRHDFTRDPGLATINAPEVLELAADGRGRLYAWIDGGSGHVAALSTADGSMLWLRRMLGPDALAGDELGRLYVASHYTYIENQVVTKVTASLTALDDHGQIRWEADGPHPQCLMATRGALLAVATTDSAPALPHLASYDGDGGWTLLPGGLGLGGTVSGQPGTFALGSLLQLDDQGHVHPSGQVQLFRVDPATASVVALAPLLDRVPFGELVLTDRNTLLVLTSAADGSLYLDELDLGGRVLADCPLPPEVGGGGLLVRGRLITTGFYGLSSFDLGGRDTAPHGWVTWGANPQRTNFAR